MSTTDMPISPRIRRLQDGIVAGGEGALAAFWQDAMQQGGPLIEELEGDRRFALVTFLWRDADPSACPSVVSTFAGSGDGAAMTHIVGTDVWFRTYRVPRNTLETYQIAVNNEHRLDPLNTHVHVFPDDSENNFTGWQSSILRMPDAPSQRWSECLPGVPSGELTSHRLTSAILGDERRVWLYTPHGYQSEHGPYNFLLLFDGWLYLHLIPTPVILDNLIAAGRIPPLVAVLVGSARDPMRNRDLCCYPPYTAFLTEEVIPWVRERRDIASEPQRCIIGGASAGGLAAAFVGLRAPERFGNILSNSGYFSWKPEDELEYEWIARQYAELPRQPLQFYLDAGYYETGAPDSTEASILLSNRHLRNVLRAQGYVVHYQEFGGGHNTMNWRGTLADGLLALIGTSQT
jgi:enterochelin esterase-like enzyme